MRITHFGEMDVLVIWVSDVTGAFGCIIPVRTIHIFLFYPGRITLWAKPENLGC